MCITIWYNTRANYLHILLLRKKNFFFALIMKRLRMQTKKKQINFFLECRCGFYQFFLNTPFSFTLLKQIK